MIIAETKYVTHLGCMFPATIARRTSTTMTTGSDPAFLPAIKPRKFPVVTFCQTFMMNYLTRILTATQDPPVPQKGLTRNKEVEASKVQLLCPLVIPKRYMRYHGYA